MIPPADPFYQKQWHFALIGDIETVWKDYDGSGVTVGIYDDGVDYRHGDLDGNYDAALQVTDAAGQPLDGFPSAYIPGGFGTSDLHGTAVAGIIAAEANGSGGTGLAPRASITGINIFGTDVPGNVNTDPETFFALAAQGDRFAISQNSWGSIPWQLADSSLADPQGFAGQLETAYAGIAASGRGGLGTVITQAAGNDALDANRDGVNASRYTITVAATDPSGFAAAYSNFGASILVAAPAASVTTDLAGFAGDTTGDYQTGFGGTSAATPVVSGIVALMLEANPTLGWRDVQGILAASATHTGSDFGGLIWPEDGEWTLNHAGGWNGGGMHVASNYGYGMVNVFNAVRMAEVWSLFQPAPATSANECRVTSTGFTGSLAVPDGGSTGSSLRLTVGQGITIEHVALTLDIKAQRIGDLRVMLVSPQGTEVVVALEQRQLRQGVDGTWIYGIDGLRGELSAGAWTVTLVDRLAGNATTLHSAALEIYGSPTSADDVHHVTDEFRMMTALDPARARLNDTDGGIDWLSFVTVAGNVVLNLLAGQAFSVGGQIWGSLAAGSSFENAVTGNGADNLIGNALANWLEGRRGNDTLAGGEGHDRLEGDLGNDRLDGGSGHDTLSGSDGKDRLFGGGGNDSLIGGGGDDRLSGDAGHDALKGGTGNDTLQGGSGADTLSGFDGADWLDGGEGDDLLDGGAGDDRLQGGTGTDTLSGADGSDRLNGGEGDDLLQGAGGADSLSGDAGRDRLEGGAESDLLEGKAGSDSLQGDGGHDLLKGGDGNDVLDGGKGNDTLKGGAGSDRLKGGEGNDRLIGGKGQDWLDGGKGADVFVFKSKDDSATGAEDRDIIAIFERGHDRIDLAGFDADSSKGGFQRFDFIGDDAFTEAGQLRCKVTSKGVIAEMDIDGDGRAEMQILVKELDWLGTGDFLL